MSNEQGKQGVQGFQGVQGLQGEAGKDGSMSEGARGPQGDAGQTGQTGQTGRIQRSAVIGYIVLSIGLCLGVYYTGQKSSDNLKKNINTLVTASCKAERLPGSNTSKFNDLVNSIIDTRTATRDQAIIDRTNAQLRHDDVKAREALAAININNEAIARYKNNIIRQKTDKECETPLIK